MQEIMNVMVHFFEDINEEEIMYRLFVLKNIRRGQEDAVQGKSQMVEEILLDIQRW